MNVTLGKDVCGTDLYKQVQDFYIAVRRPGAGQISDAEEASTHGRHAAVAGTVLDRLEARRGSRGSEGCCEPALKLDQDSRLRSNQE